MDETAKLSTNGILEGLKRYRTIAKQDLLLASSTTDPAMYGRHAEVRREVYASLMDAARRGGPQEAVEEAVRRYEALPFVAGSLSAANVAVKAEERALENFFLLVGLAPGRQRDIRRARPAAGFAPAGGPGRA